MLTGRWSSMRGAARDRRTLTITILSAVLLAFLEQGLANTLSDRGLLLLAGVLRSQTPLIRAGLRKAGLQEAAQETMGEWACVIARKA